MNAQPERPMMTCGHVANAEHVNRETGSRRPMCWICDCVEVEANPPSLQGRTARCHYYGKVMNSRRHAGYWCNRGEKCLCARPSNERDSLPFFEYKPDAPYDSFYCGCAFGWD